MDFEATYGKNVETQGEVNVFMSVWWVGRVLEKLTLVVMLLIYKEKDKWYSHQNFKGINLPSILSTVLYRVG